MVRRFACGRWARVGGIWTGSGDEAVGVMGCVKGAEVGDLVFCLGRADVCRRGDGDDAGDGDAVDEDGVCGGGADVEDDGGGDVDAWCRVPWLYCWGL